MENQNNVTIWQSNFITNSRYEMTKLEKNIIYMVMSQMKADDTSETVYSISAKELMDRTGDEIKYADFHKATEKLISRVLQGELSDGDFLQTSFVSAARYKKGKGIIEIELSKSIRPFYLNLKKEFTTFQLNKALSLKSIYSKRLYEILSMYKNMDDKSFTINVNDLKIKLGIIDTKTGKDKYEKFGIFKDRVLKPALEINESTDLSFTFKEIKQVRKVIAIQFIVQYQSKDRTADYSTDQKYLYNRLHSEFKLRKDQASQIIETNDIAEIRKRLYEIQVKASGREIKNIGAYTARSFGV